MPRFGPLLVALLALPLIGSAVPPVGLAGVEPGLWEVSRSANGHSPRRICLRALPELAAIAHPGERCTRVLLRSGPGTSLYDVTCPAGDFARSMIRVTTPRSVKLETQGIHRGEPFDFALYARRVGSCTRSGRPR